MHLTPQKEVAILVFANSSTEELSHKRIAKSGQFFETLTEQTLATVEKTRIPYFHLTETQQIGNSFGERFSNAIQSVFDKGYKNIVAIGNDVPHLKASHIIESAHHLTQGKAVLGPSADGGFYLMGLHTSQFNACEFEKLSWQTDALLQEVSVLLGAENKQTVQLQTLFDIDDLNDLKLFAERFKNIPKKLFALIQLLLLQVVEYACFLFFLFENQLSKSYYNKGSPVVLYT